MAHPLAPLDVCINNAIVQVCEDLTVPIDEIAKDICDEFDGIDRDAIVKELTEARLVQIEQNQFFDSIGAIREGVPQDKYNGPAFDRFVGGRLDRVVISG